MKQVVREVVRLGPCLLELSLLSSGASSPDGGANHEAAKAERLGQQPPSSSWVVSVRVLADNSVGGTRPNVAVMVLPPLEQVRPTPTATAVPEQPTTHKRPAPVGLDLNIVTEPEEDDREDKRDEGKDEGGRRADSEPVQQRKKRRVTTDGDDDNNNHQDDKDQLDARALAEAFVLAVIERKEKRVQTLLEAGVSAETRMPGKDKPLLAKLMRWSTPESLRIGDLLLRHGARIDSEPVSDTRRTLLESAVQNGDRPAVQWLLKNGAKPVLRMPMVEQPTPTKRRRSKHVKQIRACRVLVETAAQRSKRRKGQEEAAAAAKRRREREEAAAAAQAAKRRKEREDEEDREDNDKNDKDYVYNEEHDDEDD